MLDKKSIKIFREISKGWPDVDYSNKSDKEVGEIAEQWLNKRKRPYNRKKRTKLFYRAIARIKAVGQKDGVVLLTRFQSKFNIGPLRAVHLYDELIKAGVLREWNDSDFKKPPKGQKPKGNIIWKNLTKYKVAKEIQIEETARVKQEREKGLFPKTLGDLNK